MLHKIDLFHADFNYFIVLRKKTNLCSQFTHVFCTFALEIKNETGKSYNIFPTFPFSDIDIIRMWNKYKKKNEIKILVIWI